MVSNRPNQKLYVGLYNDIVAIEEAITDSEMTNND